MMAAEPPGGFAGVLRELRAGAGLTQQELADAAGVSPRTVSDLERGVAAMPQRETVRRLGDALSLLGAPRAEFETAARGRPLAGVPAAAAAAVRSLPRDVSSFTGRQRELEQLVKSATSAGGVVGINAIGGMAGVGKTAFAVHAAHQVAGRFPGGQIFLQLHGHTPGRAPVEAADALASLLLAVGVSAAQVPPGLEARAALWRDRAAECPPLLVLDDAASSEQVQPLLPGAGGSLVLVTSRRHLSALDDATVVSLDTLPPGDAAALLVKLAGRTGLSPGDPGVRQISGLCGFLPLAVGMVARQLRHHPAWSAAGRAAELASTRDRLSLLETENLSVAAAFDLSYATLSEDRQRLFRRLGLHPGADIDGYAAAALDGSSLAEARRALEALYDQYLLAEPSQGRYRLHDLLREHARALASRTDPEQEREAATGRLLDYYQHTAAVADVRITHWTRPSLAAQDAAPAAVPILADQEQALGWARAERASLLACVDYAAGLGQHERVIALTAGISGLLVHDGPWADAVARNTAAVRAAERLGDRLGYANALSDLAQARATDDYQAASDVQEQALGVYRELGDRPGQANALRQLGLIRLWANDYPASLHAHEQAIGIYRELGDRHGQARTLSSWGLVRGLTSDNNPAAVRAIQEALGMFRDLGERLGQASALTNLAFVWRQTGDYAAAVPGLEEAAGIHRDLGERRGLAGSLNGLATVLRMTGDYPAAVRALEEALGVSRDMGDLAGQAYSLHNLGAVLRMTSDYPAAAGALDEALAHCRATGDRGAEAETLNERGTVHRVCGELAPARECHHRSLELSREIGSSWDEASALAGLGRCAVAGGDAGQGEALLRQALEIFQRMGAAEVPELLAELDALTGPPPAQ
jgi:tetratricopeptide (TPR) repeat protein/transcriptional regulator with XRE-family HTH domain